MKEIYEAPHVECVGSLADVTAGALQPRNFFDGVKPTGTSINQPVYS